MVRRGQESFAAVVGSDLASGLSMVRRCSLNRSFKRRLVFPMYCYNGYIELCFLCRRSG